ncbi:hypothetical protein [Streptomyces sp. NPDC002209]|uniref:hypothetical protein n=1 Tax=Streptomyces sp. NPDC002209 TaxID=3364638 RepID=UPI0036912AB8
MNHGLHTPAPSRSARRILRFGIALTSAAFVSGAVALPASAATGPPNHAPGTRITADDPNREPGSSQCRPGYVWRDGFEGDGLCVTPAEREAAQNPNRLPGSNQCQPGYVWRDAWEGDGKCVTTAEREEAHAWNSKRQPGSNRCQPGYVWRLKFEGDLKCVTPAERDITD